MKTKKKKRKHTHIGYFFFKVPDSQKSDNLNSKKNSVLGFLFFNLENYKSETLWHRKAEHILILTVDLIIKKKNKKQTLF